MNKNWLKANFFVAKFEVLFYHNNMRIISGKYRGKKLKDFNLNTTKPTLDRVKESIFNLIQFDIVDSVVLDLFAGTGALGVEAISRGAKLTHFVDLNDNAVSIIKQNLNGIDGEYKVYCLDYETYLLNTTEKFDIVFLDPPYKTDLGLKALSILNSNNLLNKNAIVIFETSVDNEFEIKINGFDIIKKKYGNVLVYKLTKKD